MKRTINIGDKYKNMIEEYEYMYDKEEFNMLITKLLSSNLKLKKLNIDLVVIADLIADYNIDFFTLMSCLSNSRKDIPVIKAEEVINKTDSPIISSGPVKREKRKNEIDNVNSEKIIEAARGYKADRGISKTKTNIPKVQEIVEDEKQEFLQNAFKKKKSTTRDLNRESEQTTTNNQNQNTNPILALGIDLR